MAYFIILVKFNLLGIIVWNSHRRLTNLLNRSIGLNYLCLLLSKLIITATYWVLTVCIINHMGYISSTSLKCMVLGWFQIFIGFLKVRCIFYNVRIFHIAIYWSFLLLLGWWFPDLRLIWSLFIEIQTGITGNPEVFSICFKLIIILFVLLKISKTRFISRGFISSFFDIWGVSISLNSTSIKFSCLFLYFNRFHVQGSEAIVHFSIGVLKNSLNEAMIYLWVICLSYWSIDHRKMYTFLVLWIHYLIEFLTFIHMSWCDL